MKTIAKVFALGLAAGAAMPILQNNLAPTTSVARIQSAQNRVATMPPLNGENYPDLRGHNSDSTSSPDKNDNSSQTFPIIMASIFPALCLCCCLKLCISCYSDELEGLAMALRERRQAPSQDEVRRDEVREQQYRQDTPPPHPLQPVINALRRDGATSPEPNRDSSGVVTQTTQPQTQPQPQLSASLVFPQQQQ